MSSMLENMRWRMPRKSTPAGRWGRWARAVSARHRRVVSKYRVVVMAFLRQAIPLYLSSHRWELKAWSLFPRINLVTRPILHESVPKTLSSLLSFAGLLSRAEEAQEIRRELLNRLLKGRAPAKATAFWEAGTEGTPTEPGMSSLRIGMTNRRGIVDRNSIFASSRLPTQPPLSRVYRRLAGHEVEPLGRKLLERESFNIARRVVEERRRIEGYAHTATVTRQLQISRKTLEHTKEAERKLAEHLAGLNKVRDPVHGIPPMSLPAAFSLEQLTDQVMRRIDDRIVAHKERMGKLF